MRGRGGQKPEDRPRGPTSSEGRREARPQTSRSDVPCGQHEGDRRPRERGRHREDTRTTLPRPPPPPLTENAAGRAGGGRGPHGGARRHGGAVRGRGRGRGEFSSPSACGSDRAQHTRVTRARGDPGGLGAVSPGRFTRALWESELALARRKRARTQTDKSEARAGREAALRFPTQFAWRLLCVRSLRKRHGNVSSEASRQASSSTRDWQPPGAAGSHPPSWTNKPHRIRPRPPTPASRRDARRTRTPPADTGFGEGSGWGSVRWACRANTAPS